MRFLSRLLVLVFSLGASVAFAVDLDPNFETGVRWKFVHISNEPSVSFQFLENKFLIEPIALDAKTSLGITQDGIYVIPAAGDLCFLAIRFPLNYKINLDELRIVRAVKNLNINPSRSDYPKAIEGIIADFHFAAVQGKDMFVATKARKYMLKSELVRRYFGGKKPKLTTIPDISYLLQIEGMRTPLSGAQHRTSRQKCTLELLQKKDVWEQLYYKSETE